MNPVKCWAMDRLLALHEGRGDKIIVFSESVYALKLYAEKYGALAICGDTPLLDRETFIRSFKTPNSGACAGPAGRPRAGNRRREWRGRWEWRGRRALLCTQSSHTLCRLPSTAPIYRSAQASTRCSCPRWATWRWTCPTPT
jgi:hypothetical protein